MYKMSSLSSVPWKAVLITESKLRIAAAVFVCLNLAQAADRYVAENGTPGGDGTISRPWDLQTALNHPAAVQPGDTIWVRGGTYRAPSSNGFAGYLHGT